MREQLSLEWLGTIPYSEALEIQEHAVRLRKVGETGDRILLMEHPPVITLGRRADASNLLTSNEELARRGTEVYEVARGGDITFHGPGQLVGYPILDLKERGSPNVYGYLRSLESCLVDALANIDLSATAIPNLTGVFMEGGSPPRKIASIGVAVRRWVTLHGFALNVTIDPEHFADIVPCGLSQVQITSVAEEHRCRTSPSLFDTTRKAVEEALRCTFG